MRQLRRLAKPSATANLPPCGGDVRQDRGGCEGTPAFKLPHSHASHFLRVQRSLVATPAGQHPPLSCRTSPPQGGRSDVACGFANLQRRAA
ncbi:hypothetical protein FJ414_11025 [Mesorhizobium sp. B3-1-6]|nr:hypothetical protein FJ414_11025 [Mesorhizobium sp. B3-1-6]TPI68979.1 hypothetical protein FJ424_06190 [Mesorhizobium sp. B3-1-8]TPI74747.1 hypothetical protein FJ420_04105 [Mesorhizobium sp. B3-1-3]